MAEKQKPGRDEKALAYYRQCLSGEEKGLAAAKARAQHPDATPYEKKAAVETAEARVEHARRQAQMPTPPATPEAAAAEADAGVV